jgi:hypothetical protein
MIWQKNNKMYSLTSYPNLQIQKCKGFNLNLVIERENKLLYKYLIICNNHDGLIHLLKLKYIYSILKLGWYKWRHLLYSFSCVTTMSVMRVHIILYVVKHELHFSTCCICLTRSFPVPSLRSQQVCKASVYLCYPFIPLFKWIKTFCHLGTVFSRR